jgi:hypothetical protein
LVGARSCLLKGYNTFRMIARGKSGEMMNC